MHYLATICAVLSGCLVGEDFTVFACMTPLCPTAEVGFLGSYCLGLGKDFIFLATGCLTHFARRLAGNAPVFLP
jgi:hypothetical protein